MIFNHVKIGDDNYKLKDNFLIHNGDDIAVGWRNGTPYFIVTRPQPKKWYQFWKKTYVRFEVGVEKVKND